MNFYFLLIGFVLIFIGGQVIYRSHSLIGSITNKKEINEIDISDIENPKNEVRIIEGSVKPINDELKICNSPLTGEQCVLYSCEVKEKIVNPTEDKEWKTVREDRELNNFLLEDEQGNSIIVDIENADIEEEEFFDTGAEEISTSTKESNLDFFKSQDMNNRCYIENEILIGENKTVVGKIDTSSKSDIDYKITPIDELHNYSSEKNTNSLDKKSLKYFLTLLIGIGIITLGVILIILTNF
jgi:hypothetical protein